MPGLVREPRGHPRESIRLVHENIVRNLSMRYAQNGGLKLVGSRNLVSEALVVQSVLDRACYGYV